MRRTPLVLFALLGLAVPAFAQDQPPKLGARLAACENGPRADQRFAVFVGSMPAMAGTRRMAMRFDLEERGGAATAAPQMVKAPKLSRWNRSKPGAAGFVYTKRVGKLQPGNWYRTVVRFRWYDAHGRVQRTAKRVTPFCHQPDPRANLQLESLGAARPGSYLVTIVNAGKSAAEESTVGVEPKPETSAEHRVPPLSPGERTTVVVEGDPCAADAVVVVQLDSKREVDESREDDNRVEQACPQS